MMNNFAGTPTLVPSQKWIDYSERYPVYESEWRLIWIASDLPPDMFQLVKFIEAKENGHVIVEFRDQHSASERGTLLLDLEDSLKANIDPGITVWLAPLGDRNSLRNLRGIEMK